MFRSCLVLTTFLLISPSAGAVTIDFEGLAGGTVLDAQFPDVRFSTSGAGRAITVIDGDFAPEGVRSICSLLADCDGDLILDFAAPVFDLSFLANADTDPNSIRIDVFVNGGLASTVLIPTDGAVDTNELVDLSAFSNVTRIVVNHDDLSGLLYDRFQFTVVPEPASALLLAGGLIGILLGQRRNPRAGRTLTRPPPHAPSAQ